MGIKETLWWFASWMIPGMGMFLEVRAPAAVLRCCKVLCTRHGVAAAALPSLFHTE
jgi:hypothetical protein